MTNPETNPPPATVTTAPPVPPAPTPTPAPVVVPPQQQSPQIGDALSQMASHVASLPERIVDALRESTPKPSEAPPSGSAPTNPSTTQPAIQSSGGDTRSGKQRFLDGWFGKGRY